MAATDKCATCGHDPAVHSLAAPTRFRQKLPASPTRYADASALCTFVFISNLMDFPLGTTDPTEFSKGLKNRLERKIPPPK